MNKIGVQSTGSIIQGDIEAGYRRIKEAGFDCVDFNFDEYLHCTMVERGEINAVLDRPVEEVWEDFKVHKRAAAECGLIFEQMHAPFPLRQKGADEVNAKMLRITKNCIDICARMGGRYLVVHPVTLAYACSKKEEHDFNMEMYQELIPMAKKCGIVICLENMFIDQKAHLTEGACSDFVEAAAWIDELNGIAGEEIFGFCFDVGHANILGKNLYQSVLALGGRLKILHIHDNDGVSDLHTMPYTFARSWNPAATDWEGFLRGLREIKYEGVIN
ncbi:MAG: sugar phosphate isomerase/epimerase, partial [Schaedlerella sp.]|uniref:sugar phosphate isomerase/epimerase family protein n=1 Tax=Schaedlerella sp. TaxID=2676057 RepID=UPI0035284A7E